MTAAPQVSSIVSARYATALIDLAEAAKKIDTVESDLNNLESMIKSSDDLKLMIRSPLVNRKQQEKAISALAQKAKFHELTANFLGVLINNRRLYALETILKAARKELSHRRGEISAQVQTATALSAKQISGLQGVISKAVGSDVFLEAKVDPDILGGMIVTVGSRMIDDSVRRKLERLRSAMSKQANQNVVTKIEEVG